MKALEILYHLLSTAGASNKKELHEAIVELEELMKPKSCNGCVNEQFGIGYACNLCGRNFLDRYTHQGRTDD